MRLLDKILDKYNIEIGGAIIFHKRRMPIEKISLSNTVDPDTFELTKKKQVILSINLSEVIKEKNNVPLRNVIEKINVGDITIIRKREYQIIQKLDRI